MNRDTSKGLSLGIDVGSTTAKVVVVDENDTVLFSQYVRHHADVRATVEDILAAAGREFGGVAVSAAVTGSAGMSLAEALGVPFVQEVMALRRAAMRKAPQADVAIELGGEDAKIVYFSGGFEQRMNGSCAGGTGAFIDQMATLLDTDAEGLNELARGARTIYPIASRCGVFAKTDVQPLLNEGARKEDVAASIFLAVANQTISGLACGRPIRGNVALLGGPLHYLSELREAFKRALGTDDEHLLLPPQGQLAVAYGAALYAEDAAGSIEDLRARLHAAPVKLEGAAHLPRLFASAAEREAFACRHARDSIEELPLAAARGNAFLGIDAGSTTFKLALVDEQGRLLYQRYRGNGGDVLGCAAEEISALYRALPSDADGHARVSIARAVSTGYGEALLAQALSLDAGEIETIAHLRAAQELNPDVDFVLDIGGQDMKCMRVKDGCIEDIMLNEACSSGCGSFIETFAKSLGCTIEEFTTSALDAENPVDLGSRCTVFMNSRVKQAQKEGAGVGDIAAGLAYSVVRNALFKVIKARDAKELGRNIVVQGGTFLNDAVLRAFELIGGCEATRPAQAGLMGAYGAALIGCDQWRAQGAAGTTSMLGAGEIEAMHPTQRTVRCSGCANACQLTVSDFGKDAAGRRRRFVSGNRCEKGAQAQGRSADTREGARTREDERAETGAQVQARGSVRVQEDARAQGAARRSAASDVPAAAPDRLYVVGGESILCDGIPDVMDYKQRRLFGYVPLDAHEATRATVGIPRALNLYENYPFWFTFFTNLGFRVELSLATTPEQYRRGMDSITSESVCYPAKVAHGHVVELARHGVDFVFMPCIRNEVKEDPAAQNSFNCPIVSSYPEALRLNAPLGDTPLLDPYLPYRDDRRLAQRLCDELGKLYATNPALRGSAPSEREVKRAVAAARKEDARYHADVQRAGDLALAWVEDHHACGIVCAGRPYHVDPAVNHAIPALMRELGFAVLTEDSVAHRVKPEGPLRTVSQWTYHARLYAAAKFVTTRADLELVQLNSFGCGLDAVTTDQVSEILKASGKTYTLLKIDETSNLGAVRIRLRSLAAALDRRGQIEPMPRSTAYPRAPFTKQMRRSGYTIIAPQMAPIHFSLLEAAFRSEGYNLEVLPSDDAAAVEAGLRYVNNDICYPSVLTTGQIMAAVESGAYDLDKLAVLIVQTGGGCRATNYIALIRKALADAGHANIPVISLSFAGIERNAGWTISPTFVVKGYFSLVIGDVLMQCLCRTRPYERVAGSADALFERWLSRCCKDLPGMSFGDYARVCREIIADFDALECTGEGTKPRVGVVGEILVKYHPTANNHVVDVIEAEGCEAVVPGFTDFFQYAALNMEFRHRDLDESVLKAHLGKLGYGAIDHFRREVSEALEASRRFHPPANLRELAQRSEPVVQLCNNMGEGWLMTAEMIELIDQGAPNIVLLSPFGCLPNHVIGKAVIGELKQRYPDANVAAVDYDPGSSEVNQVNRIKLLCSVAKERMADTSAQGRVCIPALEQERTAEDQVQDRQSEPHEPDEHAQEWGHASEQAQDQKRERDQARTQEHVHV